MARRVVQYTQDIAKLTGQSIGGLWRGPFYRREFIDQLNDVGVSSLPVIGLTGLVTGMVLALQASISLEKFGGTSLLPNTITATMVREMGPIMGSLMVAGRVGAGITSQIGSMKVTSQIDAMLALGTDPIKKLVVPRILALTIMLPMLVILVSFLGIFGGWALAKVALHFPTPYYWAGVIENLRFVDIVSCLVKSAVFGFVISIFSCHEGMRTQGGTSGVGVATTRAVVVSSLGVLICDFFLTKVFYTLLL